jgi:hypothetical protein
MSGRFIESHLARLMSSSLLEGARIESITLVPLMANA